MCGQELWKSNVVPHCTLVQDSVDLVGKEHKDDTVTAS